MDRYSVEALIRETLIYHCRNYVGDSVEFKLDGLICITMNSEPVDTVFKIHEIISGRVDDLATSQRLNLGKRKCKRKFFGKKEVAESGNEVLTDFNKENQSNLFYGEGVIDKKIKVELNENYSCEDLQLERDDFACGICSNFREVSKQFIINHLKDDHLGSDDSMCFCMNDGCRLGFSSNEQYVRHFQSCHESYNTKSTTGTKNEIPSCAINNTQVLPTNLKNTAKQQMLIVNAAKNLLSSERSGFEPLQNSSSHKELENNASSWSNSNDESSRCRHCHMCSSKFPNFIAYESHAHSEHGLFACPYCEAVLQQKSARDSHIFGHFRSTKLMRCNKCQLIFSRHDSLKRHMEKCQKSPCSNSLDATVQHHQNGIPSDSTLLETTLSALLSGSEELSQGFNSGSCALDWMSALENENCHLQSNAVAVSSDQDEMMPEDLNISLEVNSAFKRSGRRRHTKYITTLDPNRCFTCEVCLEFVPGGVEAFKLHCGQLHQRVPCPYCGCTYTQKASMERHQRQHTGERPYVCSLCPRSYTRKENLHMHRLRFHSSTDDIVNLL